jgi:hypothetical protein
MSYPVLKDRRSFDQAPPPGPLFGASVALDACEQTASDQLLYADDAIFDIGDKDENVWAWPSLGCCLAPEPTTPATPGPTTPATPTPAADHPLSSPITSPYPLL